MIQISLRFMQAFVRPAFAFVQCIRPKRCVVLVLTDHSIQSAGAAGVWRMDAIGLP